MEPYKKILCKKILVGIDLSQGDVLVSEELAPPSKEAVARATRLASLNQAELHFFFALDVGARTQQLIDMTEGLADTILDQSRRTLERLESEASQKGIPARSSVVFGKSWLELIRQVLKDNSDLVVVGTRHLGRLHGALLGSTGTRLLRKCPCPVWIAQPLTDSCLDSILVATDFSPACDLALDLAASIAVLHKANLHLLHALDFPEEVHLQSLLQSREEYLRHSGRFESEAREKLEERVEHLSNADLPKPVQTHIVRGNPSDVIREQSEHLKTDLLVMGTVARGGIPGFLMGNTAERLLPQIDCSVLAVKPPDYVSPVHL